MDLQRKIDEIQRELTQRGEFGRLLQEIGRRLDEKPQALRAVHADISDTLFALLPDPPPATTTPPRCSGAPAAQVEDWEERALEAHRRWQGEADRARRAEQQLGRLRELEARVERLAAERAVLLHELVWFCQRCERGELDARRAFLRFREVLQDLDARSQNSGGA